MNSASGTTTTGCWRASGFNPRGRLIKRCLPSRPLHDDNSKNRPRNRVRYNQRPAKSCCGRVIVAITLAQRVAPSQSPSELSLRVPKASGLQKWIEGSQSRRSSVRSKSKCCSSDGSKTSKCASRLRILARHFNRVFTLRGTAG